MSALVSKTVGRAASLPVGVKSRFQGQAGSLPHERQAGSLPYESCRPLKPSPGISMWRIGRQDQ